ncbi:MAG: hypothetical protein ACKVT0_15410 [Planctomycetaceae bacterium]
MLKTGYILGRNADLIWFLGLPYLALAAALACQQWLPAVAIASVVLWITIPHHFATWIRAYGIAEDRNRWKGRLILGPIVIFGMALVGLKWAPITVFLLALLWDKQHVLMQQHGFARIYDFKAQAGTPATSRFDLLLNWTLFVNLFLTSPLFTPIWLIELYRLHLPMSAEVVRNLHRVSWTFTAVILLAYAGHVVWILRRGYRLNPVKYFFLGSSYFMWYFLAWHTAAVLVFTIASGLLHGIQYIVISYWYTRQRMARSGCQTGWVASLVRPGNILAFLSLGLFYAFVYQLIVGQPLDIFGFGYWQLQNQYNTPVRNLAAGTMSGKMAYDLFAAAVIESASLTHFYLDSFIWKVSDAKTREGL